MCVWVDGGEVPQNRAWSSRLSLRPCPSSGIRHPPGLSLASLWGSISAWGHTGRTRRIPPLHLVEQWLQRRLTVIHSKKGVVHEDPVRAHTHTHTHTHTLNEIFPKALGVHPDIFCSVSLFWIHWLCWVFTAARGCSLAAAASRGCCLLAVLRLLTVVASLGKRRL